MRIDRLLLSQVTLPASHPRAGAACSVYAFLVHHPQGAVLVDTGVGHGHPDIDRLFQPVHHDLDAALADHGYDPVDVVMVINSHLHFDHCGANRRFPGIPLVVQRIEWEAAHGPRYTVPEWVDFPGATWQAVDGEAEILPGVRVIPTPGHTPGHQSVVIEDGGQRDVIAAQAVYDPGELEAEASVEPLPPDEAAATAASARRIKALRPRRVLFSHDPRPWP